MSEVDRAVAMVVKERELKETTTRIARLEARLASATSVRLGLGNLLGEGEDGQPLAMLPLTAALVGSVAANAAVFCGYILYLTRLREAIWNALMVLAVVLVIGSLPLSSRQGAGGSARRGLRRFTILGLLLGLVGCVLALARR